jgi:hypothetical protein
MSHHSARKMAAWFVTGALALTSGGCLNQDAVSSLVDLAASTAGSLVEILVRAALTNQAGPEQSSPDLSLPISEQSH